MRLTCQVIKTKDDKEYCCKVEWHATTFDVTLTDGQRVWSAQQVTCPMAWKKDEDEWLRRTKEALTALEKRGLYTYICIELRPEALQLVWQWRDVKDILRKSQCELQSCGSTSPSAISDMLFTVVNSYSILLASFNALEAQRSSLQAAMAASQDDLQALAQEKHSREQQLFEKFACKLPAGGFVHGPARPAVRHAGCAVGHACRCCSVHAWHTHNELSMRNTHPAAACLHKEPQAASTSQAAAVQWHTHSDAKQGLCQLLPPWPPPSTPTHPPPSLPPSPAVVLNEKKAYLGKLQDHIAAQEAQLRALRAQLGDDDADK